MDVSLTADLEKFVARKVASGHYQTPSDVVRDGLRLLEQLERSTQFQAGTLDELREKIREGVNALDRGEALELKGQNELKAFFERLKADVRRRATQADSQAGS